MKAATISDAAEAEYTIRMSQPGDAAELRALREQVWGQTFDEGWFEWKYVDNPYLDHVPVIVAEAEGAVVGSRPFIAYRMAAGDVTRTALLATDTMVHPDHRRKGLLTQMTERALDRYGQAAPAFIFNFPNTTSFEAYRQWEWRLVDTCRTYYRIANPRAIANARDGGALVGLGAAAAAPVGTAYLAVRDRLTTVDPWLAVEAHEGIRKTALATLYRRDRPDGIHVSRDEAFYRWRFADPLWEQTTTYLARDGDELLAGVAVQDRTMDSGIDKTAIADVVPMTGGDRWRSALRGLLQTAIADRPTTDVFVAMSAVVPSSMLSALGFLGDHVRPLSAVCEPPFRHVVRSLGGDGEWSLGGYCLAEPDDWVVGLCEQPYY